MPQRRSRGRARAKRWESGGALRTRSAVWRSDRSRGGTLGRGVPLFSCDNRHAMLLHAVLLASILRRTPLPHAGLTPATDRRTSDSGKVLSVDVTKVDLAVRKA